MSSSTSPLAVALDWTPNTNHIGFYVAREQGLYAAAGLDVTLLSPHTDGYKSTPVSKCARARAPGGCVRRRSLPPRLGCVWLSLKPGGGGGCGGGARARAATGWPAARHTSP